MFEFTPFYNSNANYAHHQSVEGLQFYLQVPLEEYQWYGLFCKQIIYPTIHGARRRAIHYSSLHSIVRLPRHKSVFRIIIIFNKK